MPTLYPIYAEIAGRKVVVVGGGQVAERKVDVLLAAGATVLVISPQITEQIKAWHEQGRVELQQRPYQTGDLANAWLVIAATGDNDVNTAVAQEADRLRLWCNVVDEPDLCSFQVPAVVQQGPLQIAISTGGASPAMARRIREKLEETFDRSYETLLEGLGQLRTHLKAKYPEDQKRRAQLLEGFLDAGALELLQQGRQDDFVKLLREWKER